MYQKSFKNKRWLIKNTGASVSEEISVEHGLSKTASNLLANREITSREDVTLFLNPTLGQLPSPFKLKDADIAVEIISQSLNNKDLIILYGDYDVDGITAVSVIANFLTALKKPYHICHPNRIKDGYGLKESVVKQNTQNHSPGLVITCDCGISDLSEVKALRKSGWKVVVTDHHQPPETLPEANAIVNPWQVGCSFPFKDLAGVGVSFFLVMALRSYLVENGELTVETAPNLKKILDIVAIGTICDMVEVKGVNRILVKAGLEVLIHTENLGLAELMKQCGLWGRNNISTEDISFKIGPRLNAPGRMGDAGLSSSLLTTHTKENTKIYIDKIETINNQRRQLTFRHIEEAKEIVKNDNFTDSPCIIVYRQDWHLGVIGIVASKMIEEYGIPAVALCGNEVLKGSVRSVDGINFHDILEEASDLLVEYGGHSAACGFSVEKNKLQSLKERLYELVSARQKESMIESSLTIDYSFDKNEWNTNEVETANDRIKPYGFNNFEPIYTLNSACELRNIQFIGKENSHIRFQAKLGNSLINAIGFGFADAFRSYTKLNDSPVKAKIAFSLRKNFFNSRETNQLFLHDLILD